MIATTRVGRIGRAVLTVAVVAAAFALVWVPEISTYWVLPRLVSLEVVQAARTSPPDDVLGRVRRQNIGLAVQSDDALASIATGEGMLAGEIKYPFQPAIRVHVPFEASNLDIGSPTSQLFTASLSNVDLLLHAYRKSGDVRFLKAAGVEIREFARVDRWRIVPRGFLWNDHALAARIAVLADYWSIVRQQKDPSDDDARALLSLAARTAERLARPRLYTYRSNHGLMENIALLQVALAFPDLDRDGSLRKTGCSRLHEQLEYYVSPDGPILEHSAGYHELGVYLLAIADEASTMASCPMAPHLKDRLMKARLFANALRRPGGTLPTYGDTLFDNSSREKSSFDAEGRAPDPAFGVYPVAGHAVWWHNVASWPGSFSSLAQTVVTWSNFPSQAHKLADDMSLVLWIGGTSWITNVGYWPYGFPGEKDAHGWRGSNAPFYQGEGPLVERKTVLRAYAASETLQVLDLQRSGNAGAAQLRRMIVAVDGDLWLVVDSALFQHEGRVERVWTLGPDVSVDALGPTAFILARDGTDPSLRMCFLGDLAAPPDRLKGSISPFGGWVVRAGVPASAPALVLSQPGSDSMTVTVVQRGTKKALTDAALPRLDRTSADVWRVRLPYESGVKTVTWDGRVLAVSRPDGSTASVTPVAMPEADAAREQLVAHYRTVAASYERFPDLTAYRIRASIALLGVLLLQEATFFFLRRFAPRAVTPLRVAALAGWLVVGGLMHFWYLNK